MSDAPFVLNFDDPRWRGASVIVSLDGSPVLLSGNRIVELLRRERELVRLLAAGATPSRPGASQPSEPAEDLPASRGYVPPSDDVVRISHATLSYRIKRIYDYGARQRRLRETHAQIIVDLIASFDGRLPEHPSRALEQNLTAMLRWRSVPAEVKDTIQKFLAHYLEEKARRRAEPGSKRLG